MAKLNDFFVSGDEVLADVTYPSGTITTSETVQIDLSAPAENISVDVFHYEGATGGRNYNTSQRIRFNRFKRPTRRPAVTDMILGDAQNLDIQLERNPADTNTDLDGAPAFKVVCSTANRTWANSYTSNRRFVDTNGNGVYTQDAITAGVTDWVGCYGANYLSKYFDDQGKLIVYSTTRPQDTTGTYKFEQASKGQNKMLGYNKETSTWLTDEAVSTGDVVFHLWGGTTTGYANYITGQVIGTVDATNKRIAGVNVTGSTYSLQPQLPYDCLGTNGPGLGATLNYPVMTLGKGYMTNNTNHAQTLTKNVSGVLTWGGVPAYSNDWNNYVGGVVKFWDGVDPTAYQVATIALASGTTSATLRDFISVGGYNQANDTPTTNYEIWLWYDITGGDTGYTNVPITTLTSGQWGVTSGIEYFRDVRGSATEPYRGSWFHNDPNDSYLQQTSVIFFTTGDSHGTIGAAGVDNYRGHMLNLDFTGCELRDGTDCSNGIPLPAGTFITSNWGNGYYSPNGTDWYASLKDPRSIGNSPTHQSAFADSDPVWWERRVIRWSGTEWEFNVAGEGVNQVIDRWEDPVGAKAQYESEVWQASGITNAAAVGQAIWTYFYNLDTGVWQYTYTTGGNADQMLYNTRIVNNTSTDNNYFIAQERYYDDFMDELLFYGLRFEPNQTWLEPAPFHHKPRFGISNSNQRIYVNIMPWMNETSVARSDNFTLGQTRIIVRGKKL